MPLVKHWNPVLDGTTFVQPRVNHYIEIARGEWASLRSTAVGLQRIPVVSACPADQYSFVLKVLDQPEDI